MRRTEKSRSAAGSLPGNLAGFVDGLLGRNCNPGGVAFSDYVIGLDLTVRDYRKDAYEYVCGYLLGLDERRKNAFPVFHSKN